MRTSYFFFGLLALLVLPVAAFAQEFTPLTNLPGISDAARTNSLPAFFNNLYRLCIGAAAVIAVIQIMRAGTYFMFNKGSVAHNEKGKGLIANSLLGLLLVLSPTIIFGIINPDILNLKLDLNDIKIENAATTPGTGQPQQNLSSTLSETGTVLKKHVTGVKLAAEVFITQCSVVHKGAASSRGCTRSCSPAGTNFCDAQSCSEYTGFCSIPATGLYLTATNPPQPFTDSKARYDAYLASCAADGGSLLIKTPAGGSGGQVVCPGTANDPKQCIVRDVYCKPL